MASFDGNCSAYWSPYPCCNSYETSPSNSSYYFESPVSSSSPHMAMLPMYEQNSEPCYFYPEPNQCNHYPPLSPIIPPQFSYVPPPPSISPPIRPPSNAPSRLQYTVRQRWLLNEIFEHVPYPNSVQKSVIADRIQASREQIRIWFQNRRRLVVQGHHHRLPSRRQIVLPIDSAHLVQTELESILLDLDLHKNAPQRMPIGQTSRRQERGVRQKK